MSENSPCDQNGKEEPWVIVHVPYGSKAAGLTDVPNNQRVFTEYLRGVMVSDPDPNVYVYPNVQEAVNNPNVAQKSMDALTESPVVYIMAFDQDEKMWKGRWLAKAIGDDKVRDNYRLYKRPYVVYVGETNDILKRTNQHLVSGNRFGNVGDEETFDDIVEEVDERTRVDKVIQKAVADRIPIREYIVWDTYFTKSMTLDLENKFIDYFRALDGVYVLNGRGNPQRSYYKSDKKDAVCSRVWTQLSFGDPELFPPEKDIWNSELYKVSPFHSLGKGQSRAVNDICDNVLKLIDGKPIGDERLDGATHDSRLLVVEGASGTGKSIVLSTLFVRLSEALRQQDEDDDGFRARPSSRVCLVVNQDSQVAMYTNLAKNIGLIRNMGNDNCVYKATSYLNAIRSEKRKAPDVVLVDEAHLLLTSIQPNARKNGYGKEYHGNQLFDILISGAKVVIAVFDPEQVMRKRQQWDPGLVKEMVPSGKDCDDGSLTYSGPILLKSNNAALPDQGVFNAYHVALMEQFRIDASANVIAWIDRLTDREKHGMDPIPADTTPRNPPQGVHGEKPYDVRVYSSPLDLASAIERRRMEYEEKTRKTSATESDHFSAPLCRMLATYDWRYDTGSGEGVVKLYRVPRADGCMHWAMPEDGHAPEGFSGNDLDVFSAKWNYSEPGVNKDKTWSGNPAADHEIGSYFSIQGFDLNYAGVIIGPSIRYVDGRIVIDASISCDSDVRGEYAEDFVLQQFKVLIRRGVHGLYLFAVDPGLQDALEKSARASGRLNLSD